MSNASKAMIAQLITVRIQRDLPPDASQQEVEEAYDAELAKIQKGSR